MIAAATVFLFILAILNFAFRKDVLYPAFLQSLLWAVVLILFAVFESEFQPISASVFGIITMGALAFSASCAMGSFEARIAPSSNSRDSERAKSRIIDVLLAATLIGLPFYVDLALELGADGPFEDFFANLRLSVNSDIYSFGAIAYLQILSYCVSGLLLAVYREVLTARVLASLAASLCYAVFSSGRSSIFLVVLMVVGILSVQRKLRAAHGGAIFALFAVTTFALVGIASLRSGDPNASFAENVLSTSESFLTYLLSPMPAFSTLVDSPNISNASGEHTFRFFYALAERFGSDVVAVPLVQEFVAVPVFTNVYTVFQPYYMDFGWIGCVAAMLGLGWLHGAVYKRALRGSEYYVFLYGALSFPLFMQFFQDQYFNLLSTWIQVLAITGIVYLFNKGMVPIPHVYAGRRVS
jgi:oligosaccharide repeat unit polymerase